MQRIIPNILKCLKSASHSTISALWSLELASELFHDFFAYNFGGEELHSRPELTRAKFQKEHGRERCGVRNQFGIARKGNLVTALE